MRPPSATLLRTRFPEEDPRSPFAFEPCTCGTHTCSCMLDTCERAHCHWPDSWQWGVQELGLALPLVLKVPFWGPSLF